MAGASTRIDGIEIYTGKPDFEFKAIRRLEVKCEATNALMPAPTIDEANGRLRALAAKVGANVIVEVEYNSGISFTSWKSLKATGLAGTRVSDEIACEVCAETIKRAALKCRFCGTNRSTIVTDSIVAAEDPIEKQSPPAGGNATYQPASGWQEPLRDNNNPVIIVTLIIAAFILVVAIAAAGS